MIVVTGNGAVIDGTGRLTLRPETLDEARALAPGADIYAVEAEWREFAVKRYPRSPDVAFLG
jgi:hypothetical protein